jgi:hypothetical protein
MGQLLKDEDMPRERSSHPDTDVTLFLRIETGAGPRTIVTSGLALSAASAIAEALSDAGHYAEYVDQRPQLSMRDRVAQKKYEQAFGKPSPLVSLRG